ncbi:hypothetical protein [Corynebacterium sp. A21]|uniref:hypothetical protein n=1 Tax=Corynebacterium sp. A21 TaxID=3457318 RepID=UPI003FD60DA6
MSFASFIPKLWEAKLDVPFQKALVYGQPGIANRDFEGEISQKGDTVTINTIATGEVKDYDPAVAITSDKLSTTGTTLTIDSQKYYAFDVDDIDKVQAAGEFQSTALADYAYKMADAVDQYNATKLKAGAKHKLPNAVVFDGSDYHVPVAGQVTAWDLLRNLRAKFDAAHIPEGARWAVVGGDFASALLADKRVTDAAHAGDNTILLNGQVTAKPVLGFNITVSPNAPVVAGRETIIAGVAGGYSFANQLTKSEAYRSHASFADTFRSLNVWGGDVTRPDRIFTQETSIAAGSLPGAGETVPAG